MNNPIKLFGIALFFCLTTLTNPSYSQDEEERASERAETNRELRIQRDEAYALEEAKYRFEHRKEIEEKEKIDRDFTMYFMLNIFFPSSKSEAELKVESLLGQHQYKEAIQYMNALIKQNDKSEDLYMTRGKLFSYLNDNVNTYNDFKKVISLNNNNHIAYAGLALAQNSFQENDKALFSIKQALSMAPGNANYFMTAGKIYYDLNKYDSAYFNYKSALDIQPNIRDGQFSAALSKYNIALRNHDVKDYNEALEYMRAATNSSCDRFDRLYWTSRIYTGMGNYEEALRALNGALFGGASNSSYLTWKGVILEQLKQYDAAQACYNQVCFNDSLLLRPFINRALFECRIGKYAEALKDCDRAFKISPYWNGTFAIRAQANIGLMNYKEALEECNSLLEKFRKPGRATLASFEVSNILNIRGYIYYKTAKYKVALADYEEAIKLKTDDFLYTPYYDYKSQASAKMVSKASISGKKTNSPIKKVKAN